MIRSLLFASREMAEKLRDEELSEDSELALQEHLANVIRATEIIHELNDERFHAAENILHSAKVPRQFEHRPA